MIQCHRASASTARAIAREIRDLIDHPKPHRPLIVESEKPSCPRDELGSTALATQPTPSQRVILPHTRRLLCSHGSFRHSPLV
jgi:hypothetical protein